MACVVDYNFYANIYFGDSISPEDFPRLARRASDYVYGMTGGLAATARGPDKEAAQKAVCAVAEVIQLEDRMSRKAFSGEAEVSSETVGSWSRSYRTASFSGSEDSYLDAKKREALELHLRAVPAFSSLFKVRSYQCAHDI